MSKPVSTRQRALDVPWVIRCMQASNCDSQAEDAVKDLLAELKEILSFAQVEKIALGPAEIKSIQDVINRAEGQEQK